MLLVLWVVGVMAGAPLALGLACHLALRSPSLGAAIAVALLAHAHERARAGLVLLGHSLPVLGKLVAAALAGAGGFIAVAAIVGTFRDRGGDGSDPLPRARRLLN